MKAGIGSTVQHGPDPGSAQSASTVWGPSQYAGNARRANKNAAGEPSPPRSAVDLAGAEGIEPPACRFGVDFNGVRGDWAPWHLLEPQAFRGRMVLYGSRKPRDWTIVRAPSGHHGRLRPPTPYRVDLRNLRTRSTMSSNAPAGRQAPYRDPDFADQWQHRLDGEVTQGRRTGLGSASEASHHMRLRRTPEAPATHATGACGEGTDSGDRA